jgi:hypothetical protein
MSLVDPPNLAANGTAAHAAVGPLNDVTGMSASLAVPNIPSRNVRRKIESDPSYLHPKFARDLLWAPSTTSNPLSPASQYSLFADPLPRPPDSELHNEIANSTICDHPNLFKVVCNIKIDVFADLLSDHPNQPFVQSVIAGLREGFWPWAEPNTEYPTTNEFPQHPPRNEEECLFLLSQHDIEIKADRFSKPFGSKILPGMNTVPVHSVPKPHSDKLRLVVNHSAGSDILHQFHD